MLVTARSLFRVVLPARMRSRVQAGLRRFNPFQQLRAPGIFRQQEQLLASQFNRTARSLIIFLLPGAHWFSGRIRFSGGIMSIASLWQETQRLSELTGAETLTATWFDDPTYVRIDGFPNELTVFRLEHILSEFTSLEHILLHVPECLVSRVEQEWTRMETSLSGPTSKATRVHLNILDQNHKFMPVPAVVRALKPRVDRLTISAAHANYATTAQAERHQVPVHHLSVYCSPEQYRRTRFAKKRNLMIVSRDPHPAKSRILAQLRRRHPDMEIVEIRDLPYENYLKLAASARWALTFGEGLDFYFLETVFSGGVAVAVFNDVFFTPDFRDLDLVFPSYLKLEQELGERLSVFSIPEPFDTLNDRQFELCSRYYSYERYTQRIRDFYSGNYTHPYPRPSPDQSKSAS